jgi:hypothetical protein
VADGTQLSTAVGTGDLIFDKDNGDGSKTPAGLIVVSTSAPFKTLASAANPVPTQLSQGGAVLSTNNGAPVVQVDNAGNVLGVTAHPTRIDPTGTTTQPVSIAATVTVAVVYPARSYAVGLGVASKIVKGSAGSIFSLKLRNRNAAARYAFMYNLTTPPSDGATTPFDIFLLSPASQVIIGTDYFTESGILFPVGIVVVMSTTDSSTQTTATAADHDISAVFT